MKKNNSLKGEEKEIFKDIANIIKTSPLDSIVIWGYLSYLPKYRRDDVKEKIDYLERLNFIEISNNSGIPKAKLSRKGEEYYKELSR